MAVMLLLVSGPSLIQRTLKHPLSTLSFVDRMNLFLGVFPASVILAADVDQRHMNV
jgi:hypothetical protein